MISAVGKSLFIMNTENPHSFHIPVMGLGYTIDTPLKVARYGISSVLSIGDDYLVESMRAAHCKDSGREYSAIERSRPDSRALRITAYLNLLKEIVDEQVEKMRDEPFTETSDITKYFEMLDIYHPLAIVYKEMLHSKELGIKEKLEQKLRAAIVPGDIDVNIMTKVDKDNFDKENNNLGIGSSDALAALRGFANSNLNSSVVFSAGLNPRLYSYLETFNDFFPDKNGVLKKKIILKVSDYRSALIQGKILAKKGLFVSEFRIESGLNCGGHAFATDGLLLGPILEEFKTRRDELKNELLLMCNNALVVKEFYELPSECGFRITVQGGIGTSGEHNFLLSNYHVDSTGWGSPFLLVPEATNVDESTLNALAAAKPDDYYLSNASPLGVLYNNFRNTSAEKQIKDRIEKNRPGSPCVKEFLATNTEFTAKPICTASRQYQDLKIKQLNERKLVKEQYDLEFKSITAKECLCEGLSTSALIVNNEVDYRRPQGVSICPGPNLAYFSGVHTLSEMVAHIYGKINLLNTNKRPNMFVNEAVLYLNYFKDELQKCQNEISAKQEKYLKEFKANMLKGLEYYNDLVAKMTAETDEYKKSMTEQLKNLEQTLANLLNTEVELVK